ncbi:MAG: MFS transporter [Burkholderiaceae bacterium]
MPPPSDARVDLARISDNRPMFANSPLRNRSFRWFYVGAVGTALGFTMLVTMAAWMMATLSTSELLVALVQSAATIPSLLFGLFAGALADLTDRRKVIMIAQSILSGASLLLALTTLTGLINPALLLIFTFLVGVGFAFYMPAQSARVNELVEPDELPRAVALGAVAFNVSRAVGPAIAGTIAAYQGSGLALLLSVLCFLPMFFGARVGSADISALPGVRETLLGSVGSGLRFARHSVAMRSLIIKNVSFAVCASAMWALLPVIARDQLDLGAGGFGLLYGMFGTGAVISALLMPRQLQRFSLNTVVGGHVLLWIVASAIVAASHIPAVAMVGAAGAGAAWVGVLASLGAGMQSTAPAWVRARAVALGLLSVQASLAFGSAAWGALAHAAGTQITVIAAAGAMLVLYGLNRRARVTLGSLDDVTPYAHLPDLQLSAEPMPDDGPVLVQVEYRIERQRRAEFMNLIGTIEPTRRRNGAYDWRVFRDLSEDGRFVERFIISSWAEYIRSRGRMTIADRELQNRVMQLQRSDTPIQVSRLLGVETDRRARRS